MPASMADNELSRKPDGAPVPMRGARDLPHNVEAEQQLLGAILMDNAAFDQVGDILFETFDGHFAVFGDQDFVAETVESGGQDHGKGTGIFN